MSDEPEWNASVRRSGAATGGNGSNVNSGVQIIVGQPAGRAARSVYLHQVEQIFPWELIGRDVELAELTAFCTKSDGGSYVWWQGPAWAGKSALMAWFVLHPPAGVRAVSFFITARYAGQSDRTAFLEVMLEQLAEIAGRPMPDLLTESNRQAWFVRLLHEAATACEQDGMRLVLLVDGLDEDQGVTGRSNAHSIAALLPAVPPEGVRVIVAGRPNPPVPPDVPPRHPLRNVGIVRPLQVSQHAQMIRDDAERELVHLLDDGGLGRTLLGLVTAAGGGLSADDLAELSGESPWMVERILRAVSGRTFRSGDNRWQTSGVPVFVLAHEELQQTASRWLSGELGHLRDRLHEWADQYRRRAWPPGTPEYLLRGYYRLLDTIGDVERMAALASDGARVDRMLDVSGGDAAALAEITTVQKFIREQDHPDLTAMLKLAITRDRLTKRNSNIPANLPAAWVRLGNPTRAEALAGSITDPSKRAWALAAVAEALAESGDPGQAETIIGSIADPFERTRALAVVAEAFAGAGDLGRARQVADHAGTAARSVTDPRARAQALAAAAGALAQAGDPDRAETTARSITDPYTRARTLAAVAEAFAGAGDLGRARQVADHAKTTIRFITDPSEEAQALAVVAEALARAGEPDKAVAIADSIPFPFEQSEVLAWVASALARAGDVDQAEAIARSISDTYCQAQALAGVASALARTGDVDQAEAIARSIPDTSWNAQAQALAGMLRDLAEADDMDQAEAIVRSIADLFKQARVAQTSDTDGSHRVVDQAKTIASFITGNSERTWALAAVVKALAGAGDLDGARQAARQAEIRARSIAAIGDRAWALAARKVDRTQPGRDH